jgi:hypothetical protein
MQQAELELLDRATLADQLIQFLQINAPAAVAEQAEQASVVLQLATAEQGLLLIAHGRVLHRPEYLDLMPAAVAAVANKSQAELVEQAAVEQELMAQIAHRSEILQVRPTQAAVAAVELHKTTLQQSSMERLAVLESSSFVT